MDIVPTLSYVPIMQIFKWNAENDLSALQRRAAWEGIPYQTLIGNVLHKYVSGFLKEAG